MKFLQAVASAFAVVAIMTCSGWVPAGYHFMDRTAHQVSYDFHHLGGQVHYGAGFG